MSTASASDAAPAVPFGGAAAPLLLDDGPRTAPSFDFDFAVSAPFRMQPGLRRLAPGTPTLTPSPAAHRGRVRHLREKLAVFGAFADQALCVAPGFDAAPALAALAAYAAAEQPQAFAVDDRGWHARWLGWRLDGDADQPQPTSADWPEIGTLLAGLPRHWRRAALLSLAFEEDFALLDGASGRVPWLAVALPSAWAPEEKVGLRFAELHQPVADNRLIVSAAEHLVRLVTGRQRWERFVWTISGQPRLHAHPARLDPQRWPAAVDAATIGTLSWLRTERQTFLPLPALGLALFTIRVDSRPLAEVAADSARAQRLHDALASMGDVVLAYRGLGAVRAPLLAWLAQRAAAA